jgi:hypothetical protein
MGLSHLGDFLPLDKVFSIEKNAIFSPKAFFFNRLWTVAPAKNGLGGVEKWVKKAIFDTSK